MPGNKRTSNEGVFMTSYILFLLDINKTTPTSEGRTCQLMKYPLVMYEINIMAHYTFLRLVMFVFQMGGCSD